MTKITVLVGSLRESSINKRVARALEELAPSGVEFLHGDIDLPAFNQDNEMNMPEKVMQLKKEVDAADGILFITPEYNRSVPGVLKNAIDWVSRPWGNNSFDKKPVGVIGASSGPVGTAVAQSDMKHIVAFLNMKLMGQPEVYIANAESIFDSDGRLVDERWQKNFIAYIDAFVRWVESGK